MWKVMQKSDKETRVNRVGIIGAVNSPLGFYVLALLIVEAFLVAVVAACGFQREDRLFVIEVGAALFALVVVIVTALVWSRPAHIVFDKTSILMDRGKIATPGEFTVSASSETVRIEDRGKRTNQTARRGSAASETPTAGTILRKFWKPDGKITNKRNEARLRKWMNTNRLSDISITAFISAEFFAQLRSKAIRDLDIASGEEYEKN